MNYFFELEDPLPCNMQVQYTMQNVLTYFYFLYMYSFILRLYFTFELINIHFLSIGKVTLLNT